MKELEFLFIKRLNQIAEASSYELSEQEIANYDRALAPLGYANLLPILDDLLLKQTPGRPMPSVTYIIDSLAKETEVSDKGLAQACVDKLWSRISLRGYTWPMSFQTPEAFRTAFVAECGDLAWALIEGQGGWLNFVNAANEAYKQRDFFKTQLRDSALSLIERARRGQLNTPPSLPVKQNHLKLVEDLAKAISMEGKSDKQLPEGEKV